jgi:hypothetical protein
MDVHQLASGYLGAVESHLGDGWALESAESRRAIRYLQHEEVMGKSLIVVIVILVILAVFGLVSSGNTLE